jgi:hypothetical protein
MKDMLTRNLFTPQSTHRVATALGDVATHPPPPHKHSLAASVTINAKTTVHCSPGLGVLEEPYSAKQCNHTGLLGGPVRQLSWAGLADNKVRLKLPPQVPPWGTAQTSAKWFGNPCHLSCGDGEGKGHGLINYKDNKPKCRLYWCLIEFIDCILLWSQSCWYFRPRFVALLSFSLIFLREGGIFSYCSIFKYYWTCH